MSDYSINIPEEWELLLLRLYPDDVDKRDAPKERASLAGKRLFKGAALTDAGIQDADSLMSLRVHALKLDFGCVHCGTSHRCEGVGLRVPDLLQAAWALAPACASEHEPCGCLRCEIQVAAGCFTVGHPDTEQHLAAAERLAARELPRLRALLAQARASFTALAARGEPPPQGAGVPLKILAAPPQVQQRKDSEDIGAPGYRLPTTQMLQLCPAPLKMLLRLHALASEDGACAASNEVLARDWYGPGRPCTSRHVRHLLVHLHGAGYIEPDGTAEGPLRHLRVYPAPVHRRPNERS